MLDYYFTIGLKSLTFLFLTVVFFIMMGLSRKVDSKIGATLKFTVMSILFLIIYSVLDILMEINVIVQTFDYFKGISIFLFATFLLIAAVDFRRFVSDYFRCHANHKPIHKKAKRKRRR